MTAELQTGVRCPHCGTMVVCDLLDMIGVRGYTKVNVRGCCKECGTGFNMWFTVPEKVVFEEEI